MAHGNKRRLRFNSADRRNQGCVQELPAWLKYPLKLGVLRQSEVPPASEVTSEQDTRGIVDCGFGRRAMSPTKSMKHLVLGG